MRRTFQAQEMVDENMEMRVCLTCLRTVGKISGAGSKGPEQVGPLCPWDSVTFDSE